MWHLSGLERITAEVEALYSECGGNVRAAGMNIARELRLVIEDISSNGLTDNEIIDRKLSAILRLLSKPNTAESSGSSPQENGVVTTAQRQMPMTNAARVTKAFPEKCPGYHVSLSIPPPEKRGVRYSRVDDVYLVAKTVDEVKDWLDGTCWSFEKTDDLADGGHFITAMCKFGSRTRKYLEALEKGVKNSANPRTRGLAKEEVTYKLCSARLRIRLYPRSHVGPIFVSVEQADAVESGQNTTWISHTHGESTSGACNSTIVKLDPSLAVHNAIVTAAQGDPISSTNRIIANAGALLSVQRRDQTSEFLSALNQNKKAVRDLIRKIRSYSSKPLTVRDILDLQSDLKDGYVDEVTDIKRHLPIIIGANIVGDADTAMSGISELTITFSTETMLLRAAKADTLLIDATFKVSTAEYPLMISGTIDAVNKFRLISVSVVLDETTASYKAVFDHISNAVGEYCGRIFRPSYIMADSAKSVTAATRLSFNDVSLPQRLVCYYHVKAAIAKYFKYNSRINDNPLIGKFLKDIDAVAASFSKARFEYTVAKLKERYASHKKIVKYMETPRGYFDGNNEYSTWYWMNNIHAAWTPSTNNALESFNNILKNDLIGKKIKPLQQILYLLSKDLLTVYSSDRNDEVCLTQNYLERRNLINAINTESYTHALILPGEHFISRTVVDGDSYAITDGQVSHDALRTLKQSAMNILNNEDDPFRRPDTVHLLFVPKSLDLLDASPANGGPLCTCPHYRTHNRCPHVLRIFKEERRLPIPDMIRVGRPARAGRPQDARSALERQ